jgi:HPt (histidine-containing phosphotransfer) domain-containing protein
MAVANPTEGMDPVLAAQFLKIQKVFVTGLAKRLTEIRNSPDEDARHAALHRLAGAAGGFGFAELGEMAREAMGVKDVDCTFNTHPIMQRLAQYSEGIQAKFLEK